VTLSTGAAALPEPRLGFFGLNYWFVYNLPTPIGGDEAGQCLTDRLDNKVIPGVRDCQDAKGKGGTWLCERLQVNLCTSLNRNLAVNHDDR
jgi:hypothetical protein